MPCSRVAHKLGFYEWLAVQDYQGPFSVAPPEGRVWKLFPPVNPADLWDANGQCWRRPYCSFFPTCGVSWREYHATLSHRSHRGWKLKACVLDKARPARIHTRLD